MYVCPLDFGFNIPHKVSAGSVAYKENLVEEPMFNQFNFFTKLFKEWKTANAMYVVRKRLFFGA